MSSICPECGDEFQKIGTHWQWNPQHRSTFSKGQKEVLTGLLLSDGCIPQNRGERLPHMRVAMVNFEFLDWLDEELGIMSCGVRKIRNGSQKLLDSGFEPSKIKSDEFQDMYLLNTRASPELEELSSWYSSGEKVFPEDLSLTPKKLKMWFIGDGCYTVSDSGNYDSVRITCTNEKDNKEKLLGYFNELPFQPTWNEPRNLRIGETKAFFEYIGECVPGFERKWPMAEYSNH